MNLLRAALLLCALVLRLGAQADAFDAALGAAMHGDAHAAAQAVECFLRIEPGLAREQRQASAAAVAFQAGDFDRCIQWAEEADSAGRGNTASRVAWWRSLVARGGGKAVAEALRRAADSDPAALVEILAAEEGRLLPLADARMREGAVEDGLWIFEAIAMRLPPNAARRSNYALALRHAGRLDDSLEQYLAALDLAPDDSWTWNDYGLLLRVRGDADGALAAFRRACDLDARPGEGPGITNLVLESLLRGGEDPLPRAKAALVTRPDAALLRRGVVECVLRARRRGEVQQLPDNRAGGR